MISADAGPGNGTGGQQYPRTLCDRADHRRGNTSERFAGALAHRITETAMSLNHFALRLWDQGLIGIGAVSMSAGLALLIIGDARNRSQRFLEFFEYVGNVANGVSTIVKFHDIVDAPNAQPLRVTRGQIEFRASGSAIRRVSG